MPTQLVMPQLGESVIEGTISKWLVTEGDSVQEYDPMVEVNTDKVDTEIPSPTSGIVLKILVPEGATVQAGTVLALIGEPEEGEEMEKTPSEPMHAQAASSTTAPEQTPSQMHAARPGKDGELGFISPVVAKIAQEYRVDLRQVKGTGQGGRITKKDLLAYLEQREKEAIEHTETSAVPPPMTEKPEPIPPSVQVPPDFELIPHTIIRRTIAEHMTQSKRISPHVTTVMEADLSRVTAHRQAHKEAYGRDGIHLTFTAYFVAASVAALKAYPMVNSSWSEEGIRIHRLINIGIATSLGEAGLIVPVIRNADALSLLGLARAINDLTTRARSRQLKPDEVQGGTFTITNHGTGNSLFATPIINQPQCAILGVGAIKKRVVVVEQDGFDSIAIRPMVYLTLTFDHRILDGAIADAFLSKVVESLQNWDIT
jgi:2-oxoisovalerate dehydrogenase E2 component (dihydrolipoyl transacylase)